MPLANSSWDCGPDAREDDHSKSVFSHLSRRWSASSNLCLYYLTLKDTVHVKRTTPRFTEPRGRRLRLAPVWYRHKRHRTSQQVDQHRLSRSLFFPQTPRSTIFSNVPSIVSPLHPNLVQSSQHHHWSFRIVVAPVPGPISGDDHLQLCGAPCPDLVLASRPAYIFSPGTTSGGSK